MKRKELPREAVAARLREHQERGFHVDSRLLREVHHPGQLSLLTLETEGDFLGLVWQSVEATRPLTPPGQPRSLQDCAFQLRHFQWTFNSLVLAGYEWFQKCVAIDGAFDLEKFGWVAVTPLVAGELRETPHGSHYVYDGVHKSIVLAKRLLRGELQYSPVEALLLEPRRN